MMILSARDKNSVLRRSEEIEPYLDQLIAEGVVDGYDMASQFLPSRERQQQNLDVIKQTELIKNNLSEALKQTKFKSGVFEPFVQQLEILSDQQPIDIEAFLGRDIGRRLEPLVFDFEDEAAGVVLLHGVTDEQSMRNFADKHDGIYFMHLKTSATELVARSVNRVGLMMLACMTIIYLLLALSFKSALRPLKIMVPTFSAALVTAALLVLFDCPLSIFHLISLMLVVGLGLDYALFFNRLPGNADEWNTTFKSLWVCGCTTILVFGILIVSQTPPLKAIGMTVGIGAALSILFAAMWATESEKVKREI
jgi:predicted exporter